MSESTKEEVNAAIDAAAEGSSTSEEKVTSSPEVKESAKEEPSKDVDKSTDESKDESKDESSDKSDKADEAISKDVKSPKSEKDVEDLKEQIGNLNTALKQERGHSKTQIEAMTKKLEESTSVLDKFKEAFSPPQKEEEKEPSYTTPDEVDRLVEEKFQAKQEEQKQTEKVEEYKKQIKDLETKWNGEEGKPKYDDDEVLNWQKESNKGYLSPEDAFFQMKRNEILDYEVKQRMSNKKSAVEVEKPSSGSRDDSKPDEKSLAETDTRKAALDAMEEISKEM